MQPVKEAIIAHFITYLAGESFHHVIKGFLPCMEMMWTIKDDLEHEGYEVDMHTVFETIHAYETEFHPNEDHVMNKIYP